MEKYRHGYITIFAYELEGIKRLNIRAIRWGTIYRVKVRGRTGKMVYVSNLSRPNNQTLIAKQYNVSVAELKKHMSLEFKADPKYRFYNGNHMEAHLYEVIQSSEFYEKLENVLDRQKSSFKVNIALGYDLVSLTDDGETRYFHPNIGNTYVFNAPIAINSKSDIRTKIISEIRSMELANKLNYPSSGYKLKEITGFKICIYHRNHALGDSEAIIPPVIRENKHVINFPETNNKCVFHYVAWYLVQDPKKDPRRIQAHVKEAFKRYCSFNGITCSLGLFSRFKPIDLLQLDEVEECFKLSINVFAMDEGTGKVECIHRSDKDYDTMNILSYENHAHYIKNVDMLQSKYQCAKCDMVLVSSINLKNHSKNQCERVNIESFPAQSTIYKPAPNAIRSLLTKYSIKNVDQYIDHFMVYDFEAILKPTAVQHEESTVFTNEHIPVSVSVADSLTEDVRCFVNDDPKALLADMFKYIAALEKIIDAHVLTGMETPGVSLGKTYTTKDVDSWIQEAFGSELRGTSISDDDYKRAQFVWEHYVMTTIKDLLIWYNNLDVVSFIKAIKAQRELLKGFDLDMFTDGVSLPGLSEKVMYQTCFTNLQYPSKKPAKAFIFPAKRMSGYKSQDATAKDRLVFSMDREEKAIYAKMKANIAGGPLIIFNRYAKRNETKIRGSKICKKIIGYDANALYRWALVNEIPCARLSTIEAYDGIIDDIKSDKILGFLECHIRTPEHLKQYLSEMTPIFKYILIDCTSEGIIGKHIFIKASSHKAFGPFMEAVSKARREGDADKSKAMIAEMMKLVVNSAFGRSGMDMSKRKVVKYESNDKAIKNKITSHSMGLRSLMMRVKLL
ncbi:hypothetical protein ON010_g25 [Phytophthora cinnamomi]|nr:hypothetical protein ON010_g25 [Phytophthora cinnamomi]